MLTEEQLLKLKDFVVKKFDEDNWNDLAVLTHNKDFFYESGLLKSVHWKNDDYGRLAYIFLEEILGTDPDSYEETLNKIYSYLNKKFQRDFQKFQEDENTINISSEEREIRNRIVFNPLVFKTPDLPVDKQLISVMMPFSKEFQPVFDVIKEAAQETKFKCQRADDLWEDSTIIQDIFSLIFRSHIIVCDFTGKNPNVFYEAGIAHTLGKHVVPITQSDEHIPFDLKHHRYVKYLSNNEGHNELKNRLVKRFKSLQK